VLSGSAIAEAEALFALYTARGLTIATAESCTGGLVAALITAVPGSSAIFDRGFVTYTNEAKAACLGVPDDILVRHGAVSDEVARAMALGALDRSNADVAVSVTGIAGPGGGTPDKPVGLVHFACTRRGGEAVAIARRFGDLGRGPVRAASVSMALALLTAMAG